MTGARPHGGRLVHRVVREDLRERRLEEARELPEFPLSPEDLREVWNLAVGAYSPLSGFPGREETERILREGRLLSGLPWTMPILLPIPDGAKPLARVPEPFLEGDRIALVEPGGAPVGTLGAEDLFVVDGPELARKFFGTNDPGHPGAARILERGTRFVSGEVEVLGTDFLPRDGFPLTPRSARRAIRERGWKTVCGFQTRNPPHRAHELLHKILLSLVDGLLIHPVVGRKKPGDFRDEVILDAYEALAREYYPPHRVLVGALPYDMWYAGPREAVHHAIVRKNFGCTHFAVGRDHAGAGGFYAPDAAIRSFESFPDLGIEPVQIHGDHFWCRTCASVESERTCRHDGPARVPLSGTRIREMLAAGDQPPEEIMRPEVVAAILKHDRPFVEKHA